MIIRRSWPRGWNQDHQDEIESKTGGFRKPHVVDGLPRMEIENFDYRPAFEEVSHQDLVLIEWDLAVDAGQLAGFLNRCRTMPERIRVAPYLLYPHKTGCSRPVWAHQIIRRDLDPIESQVHDPGTTRWVMPTDRLADVVGFGMIYLPSWAIEYCLDDRYISDRLTDSTWSMWHYRHHGRGRSEGGGEGITIDWQTTPVHLNFIHELTP
jgi:hypothetical protein